ncbi:AMP-binding protein [bacterium]|nr:AMP-binding protein [bacterium]
MLEEARVRHVLTREDVVEARAAPLAPPSPAPVELSPESPAYLIYTSGTTGVPKGVLVPHRGLHPLLAAQVDAFRLSSGSRALFFLSTAFDASISDIGTALLAGATLVIEPADALRSTGIVETIARREITHADLPPALLRVIDPEHLPRTLETVVVGGEASPPETLRRFARHVRVVSVYGPTEATICSSLCAVDEESWSRPLLGRPLPGVVFRVLTGSSSSRTARSSSSGASTGSSSCAAFASSPPRSRPLSCATRRSRKPPFSRASSARAGRSSSPSPSREEESSMPARSGRVSRLCCPLP